MRDPSRKKWQLATTVFWFLFFYIIIALLWWYFSLLHQNEEMYELKKVQTAEHFPDTTSIYYKNALNKIAEQKHRNEFKYLGEGTIFLLFIIVGAVYIFRSVRRQLGLQQQQQNFVMAVTHELKTPISVARLNLETLQRYQLDPEKQEKLIDISLQETQRLDMLINNILISSQLDGKAYHSIKEHVDLSALVSEVLRQFANRYPHRHLVTEIEPGLSLTGDPLLLKLLVSNLLENANKYSEKTKPVTCTLQQQQHKITLQVIDEGQGVPAAEKQRVFEKFYRIGSEQTRTTKGTGLGLYICKRIADAHHARLQVMDHVPQGSNFSVQFSV